MTSDYRVYVDQDLKPLIPRFLENRKQEIEEIKGAAEEENYDRIRELGHNFKGVGGGYGFDEITRLGKEIEEAAKHEELELIGQLINNLEDYLQQAEIIYQ